jgi:transcriptional regulator with XRE-family HTH domain
MLNKNELAKRIAERVRYFRTRLKISQEKLSYECGFNRAYISRVESGEYIPSIHALYLISVSLKVPLEKLLAPK